MADPSDFSKRAAQYFAGLGHSPHASAALAGNADWESSGGNPRAIGDRGTAEGIFQWRNSRRKGLMDFAKSRGLDPYAENTQFDYADWELKNDPTYKPSGDALSKATNLSEANDALMSFLRPQGYEAGNPQGGHGYVNRYNNAAALLNLPGMTQTLASAQPQAVATPAEPAMAQDAPADPSNAQAMNRLGAMSMVSLPPMKQQADPFGPLIKNGLAMAASGEPGQAPPGIAPSPIHRGDQQQVNLLDTVFPQQQRMKRGLLAI